jgi:hypothetical protein
LRRYQLTLSPFSCAFRRTDNFSQYLFRRLKEVGVESIHGVPGDYNLAALDYIPKVGQKWVGNCNELNAGKPIIAIGNPAQVREVREVRQLNFSQDMQQTATPE